eukprot:gene35956-40663_t
MAYMTIADTIGNTPLVQLKRIPGADADARGNIILGKLEGNNPAGSVKDRAAMSMLRRAEERGDIKPGDTLIEATSGNTGIALAMAAAIRGYKMLLLMPENQSEERKQAMAAYGAQIMLTPKTGGMEYARDHGRIGAVQVHREMLAVGQRPGQLGIDVQRQVAGLRAIGGQQLADPEAVAAQQKVGLVQAVLALHGRRRQRH